MNTLAVESQTIPVTKAPCLPSLVIGSLFMAFLTFDQNYWWQSRVDYSFGWLVPLFVGYVIYERRTAFGQCFKPNGTSPLSSNARRFLDIAVGLILLAGVSLFLFGAYCRSISGATQPGSLALALGFAGIFLPTVYFNVPVGRVSSADGIAAWHEDTRLSAMALMLFPAIVWIVSAPLVSAIENEVSRFLLTKVVQVVFFVFNSLGYPLMQEGNALTLPHGQVGVADACSGIRSLTGCLFAGSFLAAVFLDKYWKKVLLIASSMGFAFFANLLRSLFLTAMAYTYGSEAIEGTLHDLTGYAVLGLTSIGLFALIPLFSGPNWRRWFGFLAN